MNPWATPDWYEPLVVFLWALLLLVVGALIGLWLGRRAD